MESKSFLLHWIDLQERGEMAIHGLSKTDNDRVLGMLMTPGVISAKSKFLSFASPRT